MEEEREMCPTCKRDISVSKYRIHTVQCRLNSTKCGDCGQSVAKEDLQQHRKDAHSLKVCDQCHVSVEAIKLHDHRTLLCPKLLLLCRYCEADIPASGMSEHEAECGDKLKTCPRCPKEENLVMLREWDKHQSQWHGLIIQRSPNRQRKQADAQALPTVEADTATMLPCEFCEGMVPIEKLLEHQAQCVNPTNVRGSASLLRTTSSPFRPSTSLSRSHSMHAGQVNQRMDEYLRPHSSYSYRCGSVSRASSVRRETDDRPSSRYFHRQTSTSSSHHHSRRAESLSRQSSLRYGGGAYSDYVSVSRRSSLFDGYSGFAIYSSISQGLDEITYGGRLSRRNSITESTYSRRASVTNIPALLCNGSSSAADPIQPVVVHTSRDSSRASAVPAATQPSLQVPVAGAAAASPASPVVASTATAATSRSPPPQPQPPRTQPDTRTTDTDKKSDASNGKVCKPKLRRNVSFTEKEPVIIQSQGDAEPMKQPRRKKEKKQRGERRKSQPLGEELFEQVRTKLQIVERERASQEQQQQQFQQQKPRTTSSAFGESSSSSSASSKGETSSECSPQQRPRANRNSGVFSAAAAAAVAAAPFGGGGQSGGSDVAGAVVRMRPSTSSDSKSSSKRSSLDTKTVAGLAQDLAAECAKAYALMESSLSKLSTEFGMGGGKKSRKARTSTEVQ